MPKKNTDTVKSSQNNELNELKDLIKVLTEQSKKLQEQIDKLEQRFDKIIERMTGGFNG